jgi:protocatechuate 3,4-dioxygenase, beta subunit
MKNGSTLIDRRSFLWTSAKAGLTLPMIGLGVVQLSSCAGAKGVAPVSGPLLWKTAIASETEPGEPLIVSGTIYSPDGKTPAGGMILSVYQTDKTGVYSTRSNDGAHRDTRIHGAMKTNADGRYEFRTIKPGSYPDSTNAAHIHAYISGPGYPEYWIDEYLFDDDKFVKEEQKQKVASLASFSPILKLTKGSDGVLRATRDIKLEKCSRNCTGM